MAPRGANNYCHWDLWETWGLLSRCAACPARNYKKLYYSGWLQLCLSRSLFCARSLSPPAGYRAHRPRRGHKSAPASSTARGPKNGKNEIRGRRENHRARAAQGPPCIYPLHVSFLSVSVLLFFLRCRSVLFLAVSAPSTNY